MFETGGNLTCDKVILVTAPEELRIERAMKRDKVDRASVMKRIQNQWSEEEKIKRSDFIVNNLDLKTTLNKIDQILKILSKQ